MMGPNVRAARQFVLVCLAIAIGFSVCLCIPMIGVQVYGWRDSVLVLIGFAFGAGVVVYDHAKQDDEVLHLETQRAARELVDKTTFGGFRRHGQ